MRLEYEIVHLVGGHLFDVESYELTSGCVGLTERDAGYYLVLRVPNAQEWREDAVPGLVGPFTSAEHATLAMRDLRLPSGAIEPGPGGAPAAATGPHNQEAKS